MNTKLAARISMLMAAGALLLAPSAVRAACIAGTDTDTDGVDDCTDNCAYNSNASQADADGDGEGNACDGVFGFLSQVGLNLYEAPFAWEPITGTVGASTLTLGDDDMTSVAIGFTFRRLQGTITSMAADSTAHTSICLSSNGWYHLDATCASADSSPSPLSALGSAAMAAGSTATAAHGGPFRRYAPFWADLNPSAGGTISTKVIGTAPNRTFVVEFDRVRYADDADTVTFQIRLSESDISSSPASIGAGRVEYRIKDGSSGSANQRWIGAESSTGRTLGIRSGRVNDFGGLRLVGHTHPDRLRVVEMAGTLRPGAKLTGLGSPLGGLGVNCTTISDCVSRISSNQLRSSSVMVVSSQQTTALTTQEVADLTSFLQGSSTLIPGRLVWVSSKPLTGIDALLGVTAGAAHPTEATFAAPISGQFHAFKPIGALNGVDTVTGDNNNGFALAANSGTVAVVANQLFRANGGRTYVSSNVFDDYSATDANADGRADAVDWTANMVLAALFSGGTSDLSAANFAAAAANDADNDGFDDRGSDNCAGTVNLTQSNADGDALGDACDACVNDAANDVDSDTVCGDVDNCPSAANLAQTNTDGDPLGDACDACPADAANDADGDTICGNFDNCPAVANLAQSDADVDGLGDACDTGDTDADGTPDNADACPLDNLKTGVGSCGCGVPETDTDGDTIANCVDNCPMVSNTAQTDLFAAGGFGDACDLMAVRSGGLSSSYTVNAAPFAYESISANPLASAVNLGNDAFSSAIGLPFAFSFFGVAKTSAFVGSNGQVAFTSPGSETGVQTSIIPSTASLEDFVAGFWTDLDPSSGGTISTLAQGVAPAQTFTIEWANVPTQNGAGSASFQVVLFETSGRIEIRVLRGPASAAATRIVALENGTGTVGINLRGANNQSLDRTRFVIWPHPNRPKIAFRTASWGGVGDLLSKHLCEGVALTRPRESLLLSCTGLDTAASTLNTGGFSLFSLEAANALASQVPTTFMSNVETFIGGGGSVLWTWNRSDSEASSVGVMTATLRDALGITSFGAAVNTPRTLTRLPAFPLFSGSIPALVPTNDGTNPNAMDITAVTGVPILSGGSTGSAIRSVVDGVPSHFFSHITSDYRTDASFTGTRFVDSDGDGIGDLVELYRAAMLNGLYMVDTNNNGIDDRDPDFGP